MANNIELAEKYQPKLDEKYVKESKTAILDPQAENLDWVNANTVNIFCVETSGAGNYSRNGGNGNTKGYKKGNVTGEWVPYTLNCDRGVQLDVDAMDNEESFGLAFGATAGSFVKYHEVPEIDAYRMMKYSNATGILEATPVDITSSTDVKGLVDEGYSTMNDNEVSENRILFVSEAVYRGLSDSIERYAKEGEHNINEIIETYNNMPVIRMPKPRFNTKINLLDIDGNNDGGYEIPTDGTSYPINFMIIEPSAVIQAMKHNKLAIFDPSVVQDFDGWRANIRYYHDAFVRKNGAKGIYLSKAATANGANASSGQTEGSSTEGGETSGNENP